MIGKQDARLEAIQARISFIQMREDTYYCIVTSAGSSIASTTGIIDGNLSQ
jgi:hypothetical protein